MGFYESIHDCGDDCYCVSIGSSLDDFKSESWIYCNKHTDKENRKKSYNTLNFKRRYSKSTDKASYDFEIVGTKTNAKGLKLAKIKIKSHIPAENILKGMKLEESKKIYFSDFDDCPSWYIENNELFIIDILDENNVHYYVDSPYCEDPNVFYDWQKNKVVKHNKKIDNN